MNKFKDYIKKFIIGSSIILTYFLLPNISYVITYFLNGTNISDNISIILSLLINLLTGSVILLIFNKKIKKDFVDLKKNHKEYFSKYFKYYLIGLAVMYISNIILIWICNGGIAGNEESIRNLLEIHPIYIYISAVIFAPSIEELVFRGGFKNIIPNNTLFIIISSLVFGGLHIIGNVSNIVDFLFIIPYSSLGFAFAYIYSKTDNIFVTMLLHTMHNGILVSLQIAVLLFG